MARLAVDPGGSRRTATTIMAMTATSPTVMPVTRATLSAMRSPRVGAEFMAANLQRVRWGAHQSVLPVCNTRLEHRWARQAFGARRGQWRQRGPSNRGAGA